MNGMYTVDPMHLQPVVGYRYAIAYTLTDQNDPNWGDGRPYTMAFLWIRPNTEIVAEAKLKSEFLRVCKENGYGN